MRFLRFAIATCLASASFAAHAVPVSYNLSLTGSPFTGTGFLTLASAPSSTGVTNYSASQVTTLTFNIDGQTFSKADAGAQLSAVQFTNGVLDDITFAEQVGTSPNRFDLQTTAGFAFYYNNELAVESGRITASVASTSPSSVTPEPSSFALLGTGLLGAAGVLKRRWA